MRRLFLLGKSDRYIIRTYAKQPNVGAIHELPPTLESRFQVFLRKS